MTPQTQTQATDSAGAAQGHWRLDPVRSRVEFHVRNFYGLMTVKGRFTSYDGTLELGAQPVVQLIIDAASLDTGHAKRDKHLRSADFFDAEKYPEITFKSSKITPAGKDKYNVTGTLTIHGVSKEVTLPVTFLGFAKDPGGNQRASFETTIKLNRKEFGINWNKALEAGGVMLGDDVDVTINLETVLKKS
jgi:polyisoprenoid-binding protein YceI